MTQETLNLAASSKLATKMNKDMHTFADARRNILSFFTDNKTGLTVTQSTILGGLKFSKNDDKVYNMLIAISPFSYKGIKEKDGAFSIRKEYTAANVLAAAHQLCSRHGGRLPGLPRQVQ